MNHPDFSQMVWLKVKNDRCSARACMRPAVQTLNWLEKSALLNGGADSRLLEFDLC